MLFSDLSLESTSPPDPPHILHMIAPDRYRNRDETAHYDDAFSFCVFMIPAQLIHNV